MEKVLREMETKVVEDVGRIERRLAECELEEDIMRGVVRKKEKVVGREREVTEEESRAKEEVSSMRAEAERLREIAREMMKKLREEEDMIIGEKFE
jgi:hypothetical protein